MKDTRFKELMNAHLDGCLSEAEARELHTALTACEKRRRELRTQQRIQAGCSALFAQATRQAPCPPKLARALKEADIRVEQPRGGSTFWSSWALAGATAACAALVAIRVAGPGVATAKTESPTPVVYQVAATSPTTEIRNLTLATTSAPQAKRLPAGLGFAAMGINTDTSPSADKWTLSEAEIPPYALEEIAAMNRAVQLSRREAASGLGFRSSSASTSSFNRPASAVWHNGSSQGLPVEMASIRFER